jgi:hypothetical protein
MLTWVAARRGGEAVRTAAAAAAPAAGEEVEERGMAAEHGGRGSRLPGRDQTGGDARARGQRSRRERRLQRDEVVEPGELPAARGVHSASAAWMMRSREEHERLCVFLFVRNCFSHFLPFL